VCVVDGRLQDQTILGVYHRTAMVSLVLYFLAEGPGSAVLFIHFPSVIEQHRCHDVILLWIVSRHFPSVMKEHKSHDVLLLCVACHQRSNIYDNDIKRKLLEQYAPGASPFNAHRVSQDRTLSNVKSAAKWVFFTVQSTRMERRFGLGAQRLAPTARQSFLLIHSYFVPRIAVRLLCE
jgi:hypothetical protein